MSDTSRRSNHTLGPYRLGKRLWKTDPELGRIYEAYNLETGAPALVLKPPRLNAWRLRQRWTVRAVGGSSPSFLALELENLAPGALLHELTRMFIRLAGMLAHVEEREETRALFSPRAPAPVAVPRRRRWLRGSLATLGAGALVVGAVMLWMRPPASTGGLRHTGVAESVLNEQQAWAVQRSAVPTIGYPLPTTPLEGQQRPPCQQGTEVEVNGGCWIQAKQDAPCAKGLAEHEGKCYVPVRGPPPEPRSFTP